MRLKLTPMRAIVGLLLLTLVVGGGNLWASYSEVHSADAAQHREQVAQQRAQHREQAAQERQGRREVHALCLTFGKLAARKPPPGNAKANPSRAYLAWQHDTLDQIGTDLGCSKGSK